MSLNEIIQFILLPAIAWLMINNYNVGKKIASIETKLEILLPSPPKIRKKYEPRSTQLANSDRP